MRHPPWPPRTASGHHHAVTACLQCARPPRRHYALQTAGAPTLQVFNRHTKYLQRERAAADVDTSRQVDYLRDEVARRLCDRLLDIKRHFPRVLDLGANACNIARALTEPGPPPPPAGSAADGAAIPATTSAPLSSRISELVAVDSSPTLLHRDADFTGSTSGPLTVTRQTIGSEEQLPFAAHSFDAVLSGSSLHWINDLPSVLAQIRHVLKPDSPFLGAMVGGETLFELRTALQLAEQERRGGMAPHVSPLADVRDVGGLLQRAGFRLLTVDVDDVVVEYPSVFALMMDLQAMGESNAVRARQMGPIARDVLLATEAIYREMHGERRPEGGWKLPATFRVIYMIGWTPGPDQAEPAPRGSGQLDMKEFLERAGSGA
ncbi:MAG: hypothetical protein M1826_007136 [Phylliscum demangeonii]|nr:MAG: hypothetical protein M1826_007136 [Phylliscum demangeonii]